MARNIGIHTALWCFDVGPHEIFITHEHCEISSNKLFFFGKNETKIEKEKLFRAVGGEHE